MRVTVKLFAVLARYLPPGAERNEAQVDVPEGSTPAAVLTQLNVPGEQCHLVLINGYYVEPSARASRALQENDALAIWPPVAGG